MTATAVAAPKAPQSRITKAQKGRLAPAYRLSFYGENGVGKSTLAAHAPDPVWFDIEDGSARLDVIRYPFRDGPGGHVPQLYQEIVSGIEDLTTNPHDRKTLVIDTGDSLESLIWKYLCAKDKKDSIEAYGYGKGYAAAVDEWRRLFSMLDRLRVVRGMSIVVLAHSQIRTFKNPLGDDFDRFQLRLHEKAGGLLKEWCDVVGFCAFEGGAKTGDDGRAKGWETGKRFVHFERTAAYDAKTRLALPKEIELDPTDPWAPFASAMSDAVDIGPSDLRKAIAAEMARIGDDALAAPVNDAVAKAKDDVEALSRIVNRLKTKQPKSNQ